MRKKILFIHGFMSSANGRTINQLRRQYKDRYDFVVPEVDGDPIKSLGKINDIILSESIDLIVGCSLGGFYALMSNSGNIPVIAVNPCINPYTHLQRYLGIELHYFSVRHDGALTYTLDNEMHQKFKDFESEIKDVVSAKLMNIKILLSTKDEVLGNTHINFFKAIESQTGSSGKFYSVYDTFTHRLGDDGVSCLERTIDAVMAAD